ncbi:hypothetical protein L228DRAFT_243937 [Xylona heveae TC161]|uniref:Phosphoglycerate mutase-like protein n=1 Tax=Xylona heveae (strain CBS 132557 / TC161) TaxID=1328760 RepID=A0A165INB4_XYLHT|nr:hypothetical protein L228DRAFT_243937 [Xylona heveae TC161]KZF25146.1 hypothetical protein L228DRAFT_243937 [Xylona heveae TC161]
MGGPPAVVIVVRHGARLDAADRQWHFTSPTPYDSPLTYGGWTQSRALGARIASLLHARERSGATSRKGSVDSLASEINQTNIDASSPGGQQSQSPSPSQGARRKHKVYIHTSPFSRCVQTSIAISAGMAQYHGAHHPANRRPARMHSRSPARGGDSARSSSLEAIPEPHDSPTRHVLQKAHHRKHLKRPVLRVDAFLGEWLSPDYFEEITPPPASLMMVAGAKADLLRRGDYMDSAQDGSDKRPSQGHFPGGWSGKSSAAQPNAATRDDLSPSPASELQDALSRRDRASSITSISSASNGRAGGRAVNKIASPAPADMGYTPPTPTWAISTSDPIPRGYVAHARDHCVDVDYQWDSMREPLEWGDGGEYGEEWSSMHKRFRNGLQRMVLWYTNQDQSGLKSPDTPDNGDDDEDTVLILVTHGAGCNALIGALTNQPVLLDVGMASLSMAVRKDTMTPRPGSPADAEKSMSEAIMNRRRSSIDAGLSETYDIKLVASTEHLRPGSNPLVTIQQGSPKLHAQVSHHRQRVGSLASGTTQADRAFALAEVNAASGGVRRSSSSASTFARSHALGSRSNSVGGLWSKPQILQETQETLSRPRAATTADELDTEDEYALSISGELRRPSQAGLWGSSPSPVKTERDKGPKRRWTIDESRDT